MAPRQCASYLKPGTQGAIIGCSSLIAIFLSSLSVGRRQHAAELQLDQVYAHVGVPMLPAAFSSVNRSDKALITVGLGPRARDFVDLVGEFVQLGVGGR
jgi:hypothetical protein